MMSSNGDDKQAPTAGKKKVLLKNKPANADKNVESAGKTNNSNNRRKQNQQQDTKKDNQAKQGNVKSLQNQKDEGHKKDDDKLNKNNKYNNNKNKNQKNINDLNRDNNRHPRFNSKQTQNKEELKERETSNVTQKIEAKNNTDSKGANKKDKNTKSNNNETKNKNRNDINKSDSTVNNKKTNNSTNSDQNNRNKAANKEKVINSKNTDNKPFEPKKFKKEFPSKEKKLGNVETKREGERADQKKLQPPRDQVSDTNVSQTFDTRNTGTIDNKALRSRNRRNRNRDKRSTVNGPDELKMDARKNTNVNDSTSALSRVSKKKPRRPKTLLGPRLVVRRLPPSLSEEEFLSDLPADLKEFFQYFRQGIDNTNNPFEEPVYSRAYFQFPHTSEPENVFLGRYLVSANYILTKYKPNAKLEKCTFSYRTGGTYEEQNFKKHVDTLKTNSLFKLFQKNWEKHFAAVSNEEEGINSSSNTNDKINHLVSLNDLSLFSNYLTKEVLEGSKGKDKKNIMTFDVLAKENQKKIDISLSKHKKDSSKKKKSKKTKEKGSGKGEGKEDKSKSKSKKKRDRSKSKKKKDKKVSVNSSEGGTAVIEAAGLRYLASRQQ